MNTATHLSAVPEGSTISVLGPQGSFSYKAGELLIKNRPDLEIVDFPTMQKVRRSIRDGAYALLPRINYSSGVEPDNQAELASELLRIRAQSLLKVIISIAGNGEPRWEEVTDVYSKDVALQQCSIALNERCPDAERHAAVSTVAGIRQVAASGLPGEIAIGSRKAIEDNGLTVWLEGASNAERNGSENVTDFMLVSHERDIELMFDPDAKYHGMVLTPANKPGTIKKISTILEDNGMDQESISDLPYAREMFRFMILFRAIDEHSDVTSMLLDLEKLQPANGKYPLIKSLGSWNDRIVDPSLQ